MLKKQFCSLILLSTLLLTSSFISSRLQLENDSPVVRTVECSKISFEEETTSEFDTFELNTSGNSFTVNATKNFDSDVFDGLDLDGLDETQNEVTVSYSVNYVEEENTVFISATIMGEDGIPLIDTVPGLPSINRNGEPDIMFCVNDEEIWLSDLNDDNALDNTGWFDDFFNSLYNAISDAASYIVSQLYGVIKVLTRFLYHCAVKLIGVDTLAAVGAYFLNMGVDEQGIYHADFDCWQQYFGYVDLYDQVFDAGTSMRYGKYDFDVNNDDYADYILWAWKGDYLNLGAGAELGFYKHWPYNSRIWCVDKSNAMTMTLKLDHRTKGTLFNWQPTQKQWWITGFDKNVQDADRDDLTATYTVKFENTTWYNNFKNEWNKDDSPWDFSNYQVPKLVL